TRRQPTRRRLRHPRRRPCPEWAVAPGEPVENAQRSRKGDPRASEGKSAGRSTRLRGWTLRSVAPGESRTYHRAVWLPGVVAEIGRLVLRRVDPADDPREPSLHSGRPAKTPL